MSIVKNTFVLLFICGGFHGMKQGPLNPVSKVFDAVEARDRMAGLRSGSANLSTGGAGPRLEAGSGPVTLGNRPGDQLAFEMAFASAQTGGSSSSGCGFQMPTQEVMACAYLGSCIDRGNKLIDRYPDSVKQKAEEVLDRLHAQAAATAPTTSGAGSSSGSRLAELIGPPIPPSRSDLGLLFGFVETGIKVRPQIIVNLAKVVDELSLDSEGKTLEDLRHSRRSLLLMEDLSPVVEQLLGLLKRKIDEEPPIDGRSARERLSDVLWSFLVKELENKNRADEHARNFPLNIEKSRSARFKESGAWYEKQSAIDSAEKARADEAHESPEVPTVDQAWAVAKVNESPAAGNGVAARRVGVIAGHLVGAKEESKVRGSIAASLPTRENYLEYITTIKDNRMPDNQIYSLEKLFSDGTAPTKEEIQNAVKKTMAEQAARELRRQEEWDEKEARIQETATKRISEEQERQSGPLGQYHLKKFRLETGELLSLGKIQSSMSKFYKENVFAKMTHDQKKYIKSLDPAAAIEMMCDHITGKQLHSDILHIIYLDRLGDFVYSCRANTTGVVPSDEEIKGIVNRLLAGVRSDIFVAIPPLLKDINLKEHMTELLIHALRSSEAEYNEVMKYFRFLMHILSEEGDIPAEYQSDVKVIKFVSNINGAASSSQERPIGNSGRRVRQGFEQRWQEFEGMMEGIPETQAQPTSEERRRELGPSARYDIKKLQEAMGQRYFGFSVLPGGMRKSFQERRDQYDIEKRQRMEEYCNSITFPERITKIAQEALKKDDAEKDEDMLLMLYHYLFKDFLTDWRLYLAIPNVQVPRDLEAHTRFREFIAPYVKQEGKPSDEEIHALVDAILAGVPSDISVSIEPLLSPINLKEHMRELLSFALRAAEGKRGEPAMSYRAIQYFEFLMHILLEPKDVPKKFQDYIKAEVKKIPEPPKSAL